MIVINIIIIKDSGIKLILKLRLTSSLEKSGEIYN